MSRNLRRVLLALTIGSLAILPDGLAATPPDPTARPQDAPAPPAASPEPVPGERLRVYLLTMGRGDLVWEKFGHNAIRIVDPERGTDVAWNWGIFDFTQEAFWPRLVSGRMLYSMGVYETDRTLFEYEYFDRAVWQQELDMTPGQKLRLQRAIHEHWRPENRDYRYDYYRDNCSTRIRDLLDAALDGAISRTFAGDTTAATYRWHTRRLLADSPLAYAGIQLVLGQRADRPVTAWEEGFLPLRLQAYLREVTVTGEDGAPRPLVRHETLLVPSDRAGAPTDAPGRLPWAVGIGLLLAGTLVGLARWASGGSRPGRILFAVAAVGWSGLAGIAGALLLGAWLFTDHHFWAMNENLLQANPLALGVGALVLPLLWRGTSAPGALPLAGTVAGISLLGFVAQILPGLDQVNGEIIALALPVHLALAGALAHLAGSRAGEPAPGARSPGERAAGRARTREA